MDTVSNAIDIDDNTPKEPTYDFSNIIGELDAIKSNFDRDTSVLKEELNKFFSEFNCVEVIATNNMDNEFFGLVVKPIVNFSTMIFLPVESLDDYKMNEYSIEIDSKLLDALTPVEILSIIIREIHTIMNAKNIKDTLYAFDSICTYKGIIFKKSDCESNIGLLEFAMFDYLRNSTSLFCKQLSDSDILVPDDLVKGFGLKINYDSAILKIQELDNPLVDQIGSSALLLNWYLSLYKDINQNNKYVITVLRKCIKATGSKLIRRFIFNALKELETFDSSALRKFESLLESSNKSKGSLFAKIKYNGLKSLEDDLYEYSIRIKNVDTEEEAIRLMRLISSRMEILDDYLHNEEDLSESERDRWSKLFDKYQKLREELSKKTIYKNKQYGLFVDYNALNQMYGNPTQNNMNY